MSYDDVCAQADTPSGAGSESGSGGVSASQCVSYGHPLELWCRMGERGCSYDDFEYTDAEISALVDSGRGVDESYATEGSNPRPADPRQVCYSHV
jgi:hypothetical protein